MKAKKLFLLFRFLFYVGVLFFVIKHFLPLTGRLQWRLLSVPVSHVLLAFLLFLVSHFSYALGWKETLRHFHLAHPPLRLYGYVLESMLAKYLPTGLGNVIAKAHLLKRDTREASPLAVSASVILMHIFYALISGLISLPFVLPSSVLLALIWTVSACILFSTYPFRLVQSILQKIASANSRAAAPFSYGRLLISSVLFFCLQTSVYFMLMPPGQRLSFWRLLFVYAAAWLGTLLSPVPAGLGVRDGLIYLFLQKHMAPIAALNLTLSLRIWHTLFDVAAYLSGLAWRWAGGKRGSS